MLRHLDIGSFLFLDKTYVYEYNNSRWGDQLTGIAINGDSQSFTYNSIGLPTVYRGKNLTWNNRNLLSNFNGVTFTYDATGMRLTKNGITYEYFGNNLIKETRGTDVIEYVDGTSGKLGFVYNGVPYYYIKNVLGDVKGILDANGNLVAEYKYDAWGNHKVFDSNGNENSSSTFIGNINPIRYRGYYYDTETKLYYLETRYYDPKIGRFISPDATKYLDPSALGGLNLYAYCNNNPVMYADPSGCFPVLAVILCGIALVGMGLTIGGVATDNNTLTAVGLGMVGVASLVSGGIALAGAFSTGATLTSIIGGVTATAGLGALGFMSAEIQEATGNGNWIMDSTGMGDGLYNTLLLSTAVIATLGTASSSVSSAFNIKSINRVGKYGDYYGMRFQTGAGKTRVLSFHTHGHKVAKGIKSIGEWHWQLQKWNPMGNKTAGTITRWLWWSLTRI